MPRYQVTASFEPFEIEAIDKARGSKSRYQLVREAVLAYVRPKGNIEEKEPVRELDGTVADLELEG